MTVGIMQPYLFPYIGYWQLIYAVDTFIIYDDVNFIKQGYINKNNLLFKDVSQPFTLELMGASSNKLINEINIGSNSKKILRTIRQNYSKALYFEKVYPIVENIFNCTNGNLAYFLSNSLKEISNYIKIDTKFIYSSDMKKDNTLKAEDKIINIIKTIKASNYINAIGGQELYDKNRFQNEGIQLNFLKTKLVPYQQFNNKFVPYLSVIDILMFNSVEDIQKMLNSYELI